MPESPIRVMKLAQYVRPEEHALLMYLKARAPKTDLRTGLVGTTSLHTGHTITCVGGTWYHSEGVGSPYRSSIVVFLNELDVWEGANVYVDPVFGRNPTAVAVARKNFNKSLALESTIDYLADEAAQNPALGTGGLAASDLVERHVICEYAEIFLLE